MIITLLRIIAVWGAFLSVSLFLTRLAQPLGEALGGLVAFVCAEVMMLAGVNCRFTGERLFWFGIAVLLVGVGIWLNWHAAVSFFGQGSARCIFLQQDCLP